jgi:hypothetical protein
MCLFSMVALLTGKPFLLALAFPQLSPLLLDEEGNYQMLTSLLQ